MLVASAILVFSIAGLTALISVKAWEMRAGHLLFPSFRTGVGERSTRVLHFARAEFPHTLARAVRNGRRLARAYVSFAFAKILFYFERGLERVLHKVRSAPVNLKDRGEASPFLREVAAYKRMLDREVEVKKAVLSEEE